MSQMIETHGNRRCCACTGVECITFDREADQELVSLLLSRPGGYAIVSGDSDFFVMDGARCIPFEYLDLKHENGEAQGDVCVRVFTPEVRLSTWHQPPGSWRCTSQYAHVWGFVVVCVR
jgi:hypothetical protein